MAGAAGEQRDERGCEEERDEVEAQAEPEKGRALPTDCGAGGVLHGTLLGKSGMACRYGKGHDSNRVPGSVGYWKKLDSYRVSGVEETRWPSSFRGRRSSMAIEFLDSKKLSGYRISGRRRDARALELPEPVESR
jgi:hypothetical protein